ncbi:hypothetical protein G6011_10684 [Alternaria panax]|uniref:RRM domain-containing protein n=1 Tax=Alternaria panax TaxID=48097 RepID=A0AAD4NSC2_9PLEO|nr:hypothetical protein G6011_10684 [Alternaria panax]
MSEEATHRTAGRVQEEGAIPVVRHREMGRQHLEAQRRNFGSLLLVQPSYTSTLLSLRQIVVEALTRNVKEEHVREIFGKYGVIKDLKMPMNLIFNINRGIAYILYEEIDEAERAIAKMHDAQLDGAKIQVSIVLPRRRFSQTPPPARRGPPPRDDYDGGYGRGGRGPRGGGPPGAYRPPSMDGPSRYRSPPRRMSPDRGHWGRVDHHGEACRGPLTVGRYPEHHRDEAGEEATAGGTVHQGEEATAVEAGDGEVPVIAPMAATVVAVETADEKRGLSAAILGKACWHLHGHVGAQSEHSFDRVIGNQ